MLILAIDTALDACAAGVLDTSSASVIAQQSLAMKRGHAEALVPLIAQVMAQSGVDYAALDRIAVTTGPGSFTGLRVGLSAARGIGLAADKPVVGLTTLAAYAAPLVSDNVGAPIIAAIDARHDHLYYQVIAGDGTTLLRPRVAPLDEVFDALEHGAPRLVGTPLQCLRHPAEKLGVGYRTRELVQAALAAPCRSVLDADALTSIADGSAGSARRCRLAAPRPGHSICAPPTPNRNLRRFVLLRSLLLDDDR